MFACLLGISSSIKDVKHIEKLYVINCSLRWLFTSLIRDCAVALGLVMLDNQVHVNFTQSFESSVLHQKKCSHFLSK
ncbi:unnamed protein product [Auanema sp. JU1783]|nr:unnamed protein product [Auanema sp. JU1783]